MYQEICNYKYGDKRLVLVRILGAYFVQVYQVEGWVIESKTLLETKRLGRFSMQGNAITAYRKFTVAYLGE